MQKQFRISKSCPEIAVEVTRDSVCAADDCYAPHEKTIKMPSFVETEDFVRELTARYALPSISGGMATWTCHLNGKKIAVVAQQWPSCKPAIHELMFSDENKVHFKYHAQDNPEKYIR